MPPAVRCQQTVARPVEFRGLSLFHGHDATVRVLPADADSGIKFRRTDLHGAPDVPATCDFVTSAPRRTVLECQDARVETVEHLMAALAGMQVDNCVVEINAPEVPAYDGSCRPFCDGILDGGLTSLSAAVQSVSASGTSTVHSADRRQSVSLRPYLFPCLSITYHFDYGARALIPPQQMSVEVTPDFFYEHVSAARTFVLESEIAALKRMGYGLHLTARDLVVIGKSGPIDNALRWPDEGVRHKILDCVGDLALSGTVLKGHVTAARSGHQLNHEMAKLVSMMKERDPTFSRKAA